MTNVGNSLAFWKKSPPKDQFANNLTSPSANQTPTGALGPNSMAQNNPSNYPFSNTGNGRNASPQSGFGQSTNVASNNSASRERSPYNTSYPGGQSANQNQFGGGQPAARTASTSSYNGPANSSGFSRNSTGTGMNSSFGNPSRMNTSTPSAQFQSNNTYDPQAGSFNPTQGKGGGFAPNTNASPNNTAPSSSYPSTPYPSFGAAKSSGFQPTTTTPPNTTSQNSGSSYPTNSGGSGFNPSSATASTSASMSPPPSLPESVFSKSGSYAPGSIGTSGTATQAGFQSQDLYKPNAGSKIPASTGLYTPGN